MPLCALKCWLVSSRDPVGTVVQLSVDISTGMQENRSGVVSSLFVFGVLGVETDLALAGQAFYLQTLSSALYFLF